MKPLFALSLSFEGIQLLHRANDGWRLVGEIALHEADINGEMAVLRDDALALVPGGLRSKVIIPNDQIRYLTVVHPAEGGQSLEMGVIDALEDATPYPVKDLVYDVMQDGDVIHIAAVARVTLDEAEAFAIEHKCNPICFAAIPDKDHYPGEPDFGLTKVAPQFLRPDETVTAEDAAIVVIGKASIPRQSKASEEQIAEAQPEMSRDPATDSEAAEIAPFVPDQTPALAEEPEPVAMSFTGPPARFNSIRAARKDPLPQATTAPSLGGYMRDAEHSDTAVLAPPEDPAPAPSTPPSELFVPSPPGDTDVIAVEEKTIDGALHSNGSTVIEDVKAEQIETATSDLLARRTPDIIPAAPRDTDNARPEQVEISTNQHRQQKTGGKPRYLGLILTAALLLFLAVVAAWASVFLEDGVAGLFKDRKPVSKVAVLPEELFIADPVAEEPKVSEPAPLPMEAPALTDLETQPENMAPLLTEPEQMVTLEPEAEQLADTEAAVLDALRLAEPAEEPSLAQVKTSFAATGIWQMAPVAPDTPAAIISLDTLYAASIDVTTDARDPIAVQPVESYATDEAPPVMASPAASGTKFVRDARGLVVPTKSGALSPDGILVFLGKPSVVPPERPVRENPNTAIEDFKQIQIARIRPKLRPDDLVKQNERQNLGGLSSSELAGLRPRLRPANAQTAVQEDLSPTKFAVASSVMPRVRPSDIDRIVQQANIKTPQATKVASVASAAPASVNPSIPSSASVAKQATVKNAIKLNRINLIGIFGKPSSRRALVRLSNGRYEKVKVGDRIDGGKISAIGESELRYVKGGRNVVLKMPKG